MPDPNEKLIDLISLHEGVKYRVYDDANGKEIKAGDTLVGHPTIGVGRNIASDGPGITKDEIDYLLSNDIKRVIGINNDKTSSINNNNLEIKNLFSEIGIFLIG